MIERQYNKSHAFSEATRFCAKTALEALLFWTVPGTAMKHVANGGAVNRSVGTYFIAGIIEVAKVYGYYEIGRAIVS